MTNPITGVGDLTSAESIFAQMDDVDERQDPVEASEGYEDEEIDERQEPQTQSDDDLEEVEWNGATYKVPKAVKSGLMMQADYTKKTQVVAKERDALSEQRKAFEEQANAVKAEREYYANQLKQFTQHLGQQIQQMPTEEQILEMSKSDPIAAMRLKSERDIKIAQIQQAQQQAQKIHEQQQLEQRNQFSEYVNNERTTLMDKVPEWKDESKLKADMEGIASYAQSMGYGEKELGELYDHRAYLILRDAMRYRQLMSKQQQPQTKQAEAPKVLKPGAGQVASDKKLPDSLMKNFKKAPTVENMAAIFERL